MKIAWIDIEKNEKDGDKLKIQLYAENQVDSSLLFSLGTRFPKIIQYYGRVDKSQTRAWIFIPLKKSQYRREYFGKV